ncbi:unnamed protein product [Vitrella brassicaformis CCMP3155]|uniref:Thioredoxin domain-containing protein n=2 Tax=Vitrella brassicaformis TaxID=1169539 RepID=A0A0G4H462_VITBC|nr:unnamed protein product [Vitrella brassicaformis CCMP3155]|mmetsp:Transcript_27532/g.79210  ORF Transcript_27532/g.79210 Transcript_27532/m.79210 type:complete len:276 (-) Transcript_27532:1045-1872(-)|eukprot:CEM38360.1 unnamed protein product [Vitrella brassicaformis CCMP3155]
MSVPSGATKYASLYTAQSSDGVLRLGNIVPDFASDTTHGYMPSFHDWIGDSWAILFSHPADFTPVCTTEIGRLAIKYKELSDMGVKVATLSCNKVDDHKKWLSDVVSHCENGITIDFPIIGDESRDVAVKYGMLDPSEKDKDGLPLTCRAVFIIGPDKKLKLMLNYPASVGRNMDEIVRATKALQLSAKASIATPANWPNNHENIGKRGWVFLLPTVTEEDQKKHFPMCHTCKVPSGINYLRLTPADDKAADAPMGFMAKLKKAFAMCSTPTSAN